MKIKYSLVIISLLGSVLSADPIANESGWSGYISGGVTGMEFKSNMVSGNIFDEEISDDRINNINGKASRESTVIPSFDYNFKYTFADTQTEVFLGTDLEDLLTFENSTTFGVRKYYNGVGIIGASLLLTALPSKVWKDPYDTTNPRESTDKTSNGIAIKWEDVVGSKFDLEVRLRKHEIDGGDKSGLNAPYEGQDDIIPPLQLNSLLDREGDSTMFIASYHWKVDEDSYFEPSLRYTDYDLDGDAMQHERTALKLDYIRTSEKWNFAATAIIGQDDYDNKNPLYAKEGDTTLMGASLTAGYKNPFGWSKKLTLLTTFGAYENDSDIDFYDTTITMANMALLYRF